MIATAATKLRVEETYNNNQPLKREEYIGEGWS